jgi:glyoxylase-like metal-dependent hydrolase (beta-lactamase superfamily II)
MLVRLPPPRENQAYFTLTPLDAGSLEIPEEFVVSDPTPGGRLPVPSLAFLLRHSSSNFNVLFDLGIKKDLTLYAPASLDWIKENFEPTSGDPDVLDSLQNSGTGLSPTDITHIVLSHIHW